MNKPANTPAPSPLPLKAANRLAQLAPQWVSQGDAAVQRGQPADRWLAASYRAHRELGSRDRRFLSELLFAYFRWRGWIHRIESPSPWPDRALAAGLIDSVEVHPALSVLAAHARIHTEKLEALGERDTDAKALQVGEWFQLPDLDAAQLVPAWVEEVFCRPRGMDAGEVFRECREAFQTRPPVWLRARRDAVQLGRQLRDAGIPATNHPHLPGTLSVEAGANLTAHPLCGTQFLIQDLASQAVALACQPKAGQRWWDACCGAGGKSFHLADLANGAMEVLGTDNRADMLQELNRRRRKAGLRSVQSHLMDAAESAPEGLFDGALVDAPCSGLGTWSRNPDARWRIRKNTVEHAAKTQERILARAAQAVKPGGHLVYAVCTLTQRETAEQVEAFLAAHGNYALEPFPHPLTGQPTDGQAWILPFQHACNGMFIARFARA